MQRCVLLKYGLEDVESNYSGDELRKSNDFTLIRGQESSNIKSIDVGFPCNGRYHGEYAHDGCSDDRLYYCRQLMLFHCLRFSFRLEVLFC